MHIALLFPPAVDPRAPHLAIPSLAASLRRDGVRLTVRDLNLEGLLWTLQADVLADAERKLRERIAHPGLPGEECRQLSQLAGEAPRIIAAVGDALATLRDPLRFFDPDQHYHARLVLRQALVLASARAPRVRYDLSNAAYEVEGIDRTVLKDLVRVTADREANLFDTFWEESVFPPLERDRPDYIGVSILNGQQIIPGLTLARRLRERGHTVLLGGTVYAKFVNEILARPEFFAMFCDGIVPYEGESTFGALAAGARLDGPVGKIPNLIRLDRQGRPVLGPARVEDVNALPTPDFSGLPLHAYLSPNPVLPILTGKGCYFNRCKFCDIPHINRIAKPYRVRKAETIAADVANLYRAHGARHFVITDETLSPALLTRLADAIAQRSDLREAEPRFVGYARFEKGFTPSVCRRLYGMGVRKLFFGLESASQAMLDHMDKGIDVNVARDVLRHCVDAGLGVHVFSIIGFPQETEALARETLAFFADNAKLLGHARNSFDIHPFGLDLRTAYYDEAAALGAVIDQAALAQSDFPISVKNWTNTEGLGADDVSRLLVEFNTTLREIFRGTHLYPEQHWPGYEEYSVQYADYYDARPFAFRTALPDSGDPQLFRLEWAPRAQVQSAADTGFRPWIPVAALTAAEAAEAVLDPLPSSPLDVESLLGTLADRVPFSPERRAELIPEIARLIDRLLSARVMWFRPDPSYANEQAMNVRTIAISPMPLAFSESVEAKTIVK